MISCKDYAKAVKDRIKYTLERTGEAKLVVLQVGDNPSSNSYIKGKRMDCEEVGIEFELVRYPEDIKTRDILEDIEHMNRDSEVTGIILQLPVPKHLDIKAIQTAISLDKDVDGFNSQSPFEPCTPLGVMNYLTNNFYEFEGKNVVVIGRSDTVGKPLARMLMEKNATVTLCHSKTQNIGKYIVMADAVFTCTDRIEYYTGENSDLGLLMDKVPLIIDIGLGKGLDGKLHGNISETFKNGIMSSKDNEVIISGTGGVGLLTRASLLDNVLKAKIIQEGKKHEAK